MKWLANLPLRGGNAGGGDLISDDVLPDSCLSGRDVSP
jgi:hypothetical protein